MLNILNLDKKVRTGALCCPQLGFDLDALKEAKQYLDKLPSCLDLFACVMPLTAAHDPEFMVIKLQVLFDSASFTVA